jgi:hypothetical protein
MLACMRGLPRVTSYTFYIGDELSWRDVRGAREVATRAGIPHRVLQRRKVRSSQLRDWVVRTGGEAGEPRGWIASASLEAQQERRAMITGAQADFSRVQAFRKRFLDKPITPRDILARCHAPGLPDFIRRAEEWIGALPPLDYLGVGDLVMVEQRFACWGGVINYGELGSASARICPANTRAMMETASRLPVDYRTASRLHEDVIAAAWPELLEVPFNAPAVPPLRRSVFAIRGSLAKSLEPPARVWRKSRATPHWLRDRLLRASGLKVPRRPQPYEHGEPARDRTGQEG